MYPFLSPCLFLSFVRVHFILANAMCVSFAIWCINCYRKKKIPLARLCVCLCMHYQWSPSPSSVAVSRSIFLTAYVTFEPRRNVWENEHDSHAYVTFEQRFKGHVCGQENRAGDGLGTRLGFHLDQVFLLERRNTPLVFRDPLLSWWQQSCSWTSISPSTPVQNHQPPPYPWTPDHWAQS